MSKMIKNFGNLYLDPRFLGQYLDQLTGKMDIMIDGGEIPEPVAKVNDSGIGILEVSGVLSRYSWDSRGNYNELADSIKQLDAHPDVEKIAIHADTPGGSVMGTREFSETIMGTSKPVVVYSEGLLASAGYHFASAANAIVTTPSAIVGSIGVMLSFVDLSGMLEREGIKVEVISSGTYKGMGATGTSLSKEQREYLQKDIDESAQEFKSYVQGNRGAIDDSLMQGQTFSGNQALKNGLVDEVVNDFEELLSIIS